jgi:hypothetical protein
VNGVKVLVEEELSCASWEVICPERKLECGPEIIFDYFRVARTSPRGPAGVAGFGSVLAVYEGAY